MAEGAVVLAGGKQPDAERCPLAASHGGYFYEPTVLGSVKPEMSCFQEEIFGPVVTVAPFKDEANAVELANNSKFGLGAWGRSLGCCPKGSVLQDDDVADASSVAPSGGAAWTRSVSRAHRLARDVGAGVFWVNAHHRNDPSAPWGGKECYFLVFMPTIREIRDFYREM
eukprot:SAG31_NODE_778_length_12161_cov_101.601807_2_plen_169_part_00